MSLFDDAQLRSLEDPTKPITLDALAEMLAGPTTTAGVPVSETNASRLGVVFACIRAIAETTAALPFPLYRRLGPKGRTRATDLPLYQLLHDAPNPELDAMVFWELLLSHAAARGNGFAEIEFSRSGEVLAMWPLRADRTRAVRKDGERRVETVLANGEPVSLPANRVLQIQGPGGDGLNGVSVIGLARQAIGLGLAVQEFGARFFGSGTHPSLILKHPGELSDDAAGRLRKSVSEWNAGLTKAHRLMLLEEGMSVENVGIPPEDSQFIQTQVKAGEEVARFFRVPPHLVGLLEKATFSNIEHQGLEFVAYCIGPWCTRVEKAVNRSVVRSPDLFAEFVLQALLRGDTKSRFEAYGAAIDKGWMSRDEVRQLENLNPMPDGLGELFTIQLAQQNLSAVADAAPQGGAGAREGGRPSVSRAARGVAVESVGSRQIRSLEGRKRLRRNFFALVERAARSFAGREGRNALRALKRVFDAEQPVADLLGALEEIWADLPRQMERELGPVLASLAELVVAEVENEVGAISDRAALATFVASYSAAYSGRHIDSSRRQVVRVLEGEGEDVRQALEDKFNEWVEERPGRIARDETTRFEGAVSREAYVLAGVTILVWAATEDNCPICDDLNGRKVGHRNPFVAEGESVGDDETQLEASGAIFHPPAHRGCDCFLVSG